MSFVQYHSKCLKVSSCTLKNILRTFSKNVPIVLGIESSCDDTGCGIVDSTGNILGEALHSQQSLHTKFGGIIPTVAHDMHRDHVTDVVEKALRSANLRLRDIDGIAATVKPGLPMSLEVGKNFGKYLSRIGKKPFIPIHHMEAHALTIRLIEKVDFPYLVLLMSGGHCLLAVVNSVDKFYLLGSGIDNAPGEAFDKIARRLKLYNLAEFANLSGGQAIEKAASKATNPHQFYLPVILSRWKDCQFSFAGLMNNTLRHILEQEKEHNISADQVIPDVYNLCAAFQFTITKHLCHRVQRAMAFIDKEGLIPKDKGTLVLSGGVASNNFIAKAMNIVCTELNYKLVRTPPKLCTDNGVMIAWNGMEKWLADIGVIRDSEEIDKVDIEKKAPLGEDWREKVKNADISCSWVKISKQLF